MYVRKILRMFVIFVALYPYVSTASEPLTVADQFHSFQQKYHKVYASPEIAHYRQQIFADNLAKIQQHNAENHAWRLGINEYADETWEEFSEARMLKTGVQLQLPTKPSGQKPLIPKSKLMGQAPINWVTSGAVTPVKNQGTCGSSWAFATTGLMEGAGFLLTGVLRSLSEQEFLDCDSSDSACYGGRIDNALTFAMGGITTEAAYPYTAQKRTCTSTTPVLRVTGFSEVTQNDQDALYAALLQQPIAVGVEANPAIFQFYQSGIVTSEACGTTLNHALLLVGFNSEAGTDYWYCKNSWGPSWGERGYIRIARTATQGPGICGIASYPWTVEVARG